MDWKHVMVDLETDGVRVGSVIRSIAAVCFDPYSGLVGPSFSANLTPEPQLLHGMTIDPATVEWWASQPEEVQNLSKVDARNPKEVLEEFFVWWPSGATF